MLAGHFTTALLAKQRAPEGPLAFFLVASQLPDMLWLAFHYLGLEPTTPSNAMVVTLETLRVDMTYSHDLLPLPLWVLLTVVVGRVLFRSWRTGWVGGLLVFVHAVTDYVGGFEHFVFGPDSQVVSTGLYSTSPYLAVALEVGFIALTLPWVIRTDRRNGIRRSAATLKAWGAVFGGGLAFLFLTARHSMADLLGLSPNPALAGTAVPVLALTYVSMIWAMNWAGRQPVRTISPN